MMRLRYLGGCIGKAVLIMFFLFQTVEAMMRFMPKEQLVESAEYIVLVKVQSASDSGKTIRWRSASGKVISNELLVIESIKGSLSSGKTIFLYTLKFDDWMEDNVELPSMGSKVLLFLKRGDKGDMKPVGSIQGVWRMKNGQPSGVSTGTTLEQIREMVQKQINSCKSEAFTSLVDTGEIQTQAGHYKEALEAYRKAYDICTMRDLEEQMAWLMGEVGDEEYNSKERKWR